ncbi:hypothetical protein MRX96_028879 [Rhipicephalus microplus]
MCPRRPCSLAEAQPPAVFAPPIDQLHCARFGKCKEERCGVERDGRNRFAAPEGDGGARGCGTGSIRGVLCVRRLQPRSLVLSHAHSPCLSACA